MVWCGDVRSSCCGGESSVGMLRLSNGISGHDAVMGCRGGDAVMAELVV